MKWPSYRCFDCLVPVPADEVLCSECAALYREAKQRNAQRKPWAAS